MRDRGSAGRVAIGVPRASDIEEEEQTTRRAGSPAFSFECLAGRPVDWTRPLMKPSIYLGGPASVSWRSLHLNEYWQQDCLAYGRAPVFVSTHGTRLSARAQAVDACPSTHGGHGTRRCLTVRLAAAGASSCTDCPRGKASSLTGLKANGPWVCKPCRIGYSTENLTGAAECTACAPGSYADEAESHFCTLCDPGKL